MQAWCGESSMISEEGWKVGAVFWRAATWDFMGDPRVQTWLWHPPTVSNLPLIDRGESPAWWMRPHSNRPAGQPSHPQSPAPLPLLQAAGYLEEAGPGMEGISTAQTASTLQLCLHYTRYFSPICSWSAIHSEIERPKYNCFISIYFLLTRLMSKWNGLPLDRIGHAIALTSCRN